MLNITENSIAEDFDMKNYESFSLLPKSRIRRVSLMLAGGLFLCLLILLFLPWTQNVTGKGYITTRSPEQRPQGIESVIAGRIQTWYVQEGDYVEAGDTIAFISEIKSEYFDPNLLERTNEQLDATSQKVDSYAGKVNALKTQNDALKASLELKRAQLKNKIEQGRNKIKIDSIDLIAFDINAEIAENQYVRTQELFDKGLKSLTDLQDKKLKVQSTKAKANVQRNKLANQRNTFANASIDLLAVEREYDEKIAKSMSDQQSALASKLESMSSTSKLKNKLSNYAARQKFYYILAPQSGLITKTLKKGVGETVKEGTKIATIMPARYDLAVEVYLKPQDIPLLSLGNEARLRFDGWPAIVISGWPESSTGVFSGKIVAIDQIISDNGKYRILISPSEDEKKWPAALRVGTGTQSFVLLNDVPIWYEIWRQLNGFPPDFYKKNTSESEQVKRKAPLKSVK